MNTRPIRLVVAALVVFAASCSRGDAGTEDAALVSAARAVAQDFAKALLAELTTALQEKGPLGAVDVCREHAPGIARTAGTQAFTVRRIGTRVRNRSTNLPTDAERAILDRFGSIPADVRQKEFVPVRDDGHFAVYVPITIGAPLCLTCHGPVESIAPELRAHLAERYPEDDAVGYALGDLRGAIVVERVR